MRTRGLSPKLPLSLDEQDGYALNKTHRDMVKQNLKMLILTIPGERMMDPEFGVGLKTFLFEQNTRATQGEISARINRQLNMYMPFIEIVKLEFNNTETNPALNENYLSIRLEYWVEPLDKLDALDFTYDFDRELFI